MVAYREAYTQLTEQGYCLVPAILPELLRERLHVVTDTLLAQQTAEQSAQFRSQGSMLPITCDPLFAELVALPITLPRCA